MSGSKAPDYDTYGLLRTTCSHNPTQDSHIVVLTASQDGASLNAILPACAHLAGLMLLYLVLAYAAARRLNELDARAALMGLRFDRKSPGAGDF